MTMDFEKAADDTHSSYISSNTFDTKRLYIVKDGKKYGPWIP